VIFASFAAPAFAASDFDLRLTGTAAGGPTGMTVHVLLRNPDDPDAKPSPLRRAVLKLPDGLRFDTGAMPQCTASDAELHARGPDACEPESKLSVGKLVAFTGFAPPADQLVGDDHVFNGPEQIIEVITGEGNSASPAYDRVTIDGSTLTARPPATPGGPPEGESAIRSIDFVIPVRASGDRALITTPPDCRSGAWQSVATFLFADGSSETVASWTPCELPRLSLAVTPRRVRAGRRTRFRLRASAAQARCVNGAAIRFAGRTARTDAGGRATIRATFRRPGLRAARVSSPGCIAATAPVRVLSRR
jgi:hypothetical protein